MVYPTLPGALSASLTPLSSLHHDYLPTTRRLASLLDIVVTPSTHPRFQVDVEGFLGLCSIMFSLARIPVFLRVPTMLVCLPRIDLHTPVMQLTTYLEKSYIFYLMQKQLSRRRDADFSLPVGATVDKFTRFT